MSIIVIKLIRGHMDALTHGTVLCAILVNNFYEVDLQKEPYASKINMFPLDVDKINTM